MRAIIHPQTGNPGVFRHLQVVRGIADHQGLFRRKEQFVHQFEQHLRMRFGKALVSTARGREELSQSAVRQRTIESATTLAGGDCQTETRCLKFGQQLRNPRKQAQILITGKVVMPVTFGHLRVGGLIQIGSGHLQGLGQSQADHLPGALIAGRWQTQIAAGSLHGSHNSPRRIKNRPVPVEHQQFKSFGHSPVFPPLQAVPETPPAPAAAEPPGPAARRWRGAESGFSRRAGTSA